VAAAALVGGLVVLAPELQAAAASDTHSMTAIAPDLMSNFIRLFPLTSSNL
jgi:hypothetical protein